PASESMQVRLDRLTAKLPELFAFVGLDPKVEAKVEQLNVARQPVNYWSSWTAKQRATFESMCSEDMDRFFPEWRCPRGAWRRLAAAPAGEPAGRSWLRAGSRAGSGPIARRLARLAGLGRG